MKIATIGSGAIVDTMLEHIQDVDGIELDAVYSRTMDKAKAYAHKHQVEKAYDSLEDLFGDEEIDTIYIASPNSLHYPQAKAALQAGKHVILEKPFTPTRKQAEELFALAEEKGVMIFEAITNIHTPNYGLLKDHLKEAGKIRQVTLNFSQYSSRYDRYRNGEVANAFDPKMDGGALMDINIYNIHFCLGLFGMPEAVTYLPVFGFNGIDTSGTLLLQYPSFSAVCIGAKDSSSPYMVWIQGEDGTFEVSKASPGVVAQVDFLPVHPEEGNEKIRVSIDQGPHMGYEFMDFLVALNENNREMYEQFKAQTLQAASILDEAKAQREARLAALQQQTNA